MLRYLVKRVLWFIPTLFAITLLGFIITLQAPGDPVDALLKASGNENGEMNYANTEAQRRLWRHKLGLDLPVFYISVTSAAEPDTLYKIPDNLERYALRRLTRRYGDWDRVSQYYTSLRSWRDAHAGLKRDSSLLQQYTPDEISHAISESRLAVMALATLYQPSLIHQQLDRLQQLYTQYRFLQPLQASLNRSRQSLDDMEDHPRLLRTWLPAVHFHPMNQYHRWLFGDGNAFTGSGSVYSRGIVRGDFGLSYAYMKPVRQVLAEKIGWSLFFTLFAVIMGYLVSIPIGLKAAAQKDKPFDRISGVGLFLLYSIPNFFLATLLQMYFSNVDYFNWFETTGVKPTVGYPPGASFFEKAWISMPYLVLPAIAYTYSTFAFLSRTLRVSTLEVLQQDYIRTARAKGLPSRVVLYRHAFRNALLPLITVFANIFPLALGGSVILEYIFGIPGMGKESFMAIDHKDYPVIIAVFTLTGILTLVGYLISDILYAVADPRINYRKR